MKRIFPANTPPDQIATSVLRMVGSLPKKPISVTVELWKKPRSNQQNRFLFGVCYAQILESGGETLAGWTKDDLHSYFLGEYGGVERIQGFGITINRPILHSSKMSVTEFRDYLDWLSAKCAELGIVIPEPSYESN